MNNLLVCLLCFCLVSFSNADKKKVATNVEKNSISDNSVFKGYWIGQQITLPLDIGCKVNGKESDIKPLLLKVNLSSTNQIEAIEYYYNSVYNKYKISSKWEAKLLVDQKFSFTKESYSFCNEVKSKNTNQYNGVLKKIKKEQVLVISSKQKWCSSMGCEYEVEYVLSKVHPSQVNNLGASLRGF